MLFLSVLFDELNFSHSDKYNEMVRCMKDVAVVCAMSINSKMDEEAIRLEDGIERLLNDELNLKKVLTALKTQIDQLHSTQFLTAICQI